MYPSDFQGEVANDSNGIVYVMGNSGSKGMRWDRVFPILPVKPAATIS